MVITWVYTSGWW